MDGDPEETEAAVGYTLCEHYPLPPVCVSPWTDADSKSTLSPLTFSCGGIAEGDLEER